MDNESPATSLLSLKNKMGVIFLVVLACVIVSFGGAYLGARNATNNKLTEAQNSPSPTMIVFETPSPTPTVPTIPESTDSAQITVGDSMFRTFTSSQLGITFQYASRADSKPGSPEIKTQQKDSKVYVYTSSMKPESGQYVEVFPKDPIDSLSIAIEKRFLAGIAATDCFVETVADKNASAGYLKAIISYPAASDGFKCPQSYRKSNGISYFLADAGHPNLFMFFSIGQYAIPSSTGNTIPWQDTISFLN
jgi:hypothetical protein